MVRAGLIAAVLAFWACAGGESSPTAVGSDVGAGGASGRAPTGVGDLPPDYAPDAGAPATPGDIGTPPSPDAAPMSMRDATSDGPPDADPDPERDAAPAGARDAAPAGGGDAAPILDDAGPQPRDAETPDAGCEGRDETCNARDDDCDGAIDEGAICGAWLERACRVTLGWADNGRGPAGVSPTWSTCPAADRQMAGDLRCTTTPDDGGFARMDLDGDVDENDQLGVRFDCTDPDQPALAEWTRTHCAVFLGWADNNRGLDDSAFWGACPNSLSGGGLLRCTSSGYDGQFRAMDLDGDVDENDDLGVAFVCGDDADPARALSMQGSAEVHLAWASGNQGPEDGAEAWTPACPGEEQVRLGRIFHLRRCARSMGDGRFHKLDLGRDINDDDDLGIALRRLEAPP